MAKNQVQCSDWHRGWGYGGNDHIGTLEKEGDLFIWRGHRQGRHYSMGAAYKVEFTEKQFEDREVSWPHIPNNKDVRKAIDELKQVPVE